ncbi:MAG: lipid-A-disaccharide synthase [Rhodospirillales bacterium]|nr:lipid-A-disaccharide synthase [Rhodospirillales bacterium]
MHNPDTPSIRRPLVFVLAGEPSGDALGASVMQALDVKLGGRVQFAGVGGPQMLGVVKSGGMESLFPMQDLAVMGVFEIAPRLPLLLKRIKETANAVERLKPDVLLTIDAPDFCFRVIKRLKARGVMVPVVHFVAPSVWAWRPGRAAKVAKFLDHLLCLLPFEPPYFEREGLKATFVGHPVVASSIGDGDGPSFRARYGIAPDAPVLCVLPGSRSGEVERLLAVFGETVAKLAPQFPGLKIVMPSVEHLEVRLRTACATWAAPVVVVGGAQKADAFAASDAALAASGTVALELAMAGLPNVIAYKVHALTAVLARRLLKTRYANLINIILDREAVPELLQENCTPENLALEVARLLDDEGARTAQKAAAFEALKQLGFGGLPPGERAADVVLSYIKDKGELQ